MPAVAAPGMIGIWLTFAFAFKRALNWLISATGWVWPNTASLAISACSFARSAFAARMRFASSMSIRMFCRSDSRYWIDFCG